MRLEQELESWARAAMREALGSDAPAILRPTTDPKLGDYQINGVMPLAKQQKRPPRELAELVANVLKQRPELSSVDVAGPGFINIKLTPAWVGARIADAAIDTTRDGVPMVEKPERIVVDFSGPNIAKQMHVGHLRSTILGDALVKLLRFAGHHVIGDNHLGDWGTQFGLLIVGMRTFASDASIDALDIAALENIYKLASAKAKEDPSFAQQARDELAKLQAGDSANRAIWQRFVSITRTEIDKIYARVQITFDEWLGESAYQDMLAGVVDDLLQKGIAREDQGAICVFFEDNAELSKGETPFIVRKQDGAFLYSTTDIATVLYRRDQFQADRALYVVDKRQALHFKQLFAVMGKLGVTMRLEHIGFGAVLGKDGKPLKTRDGKNVTLAALLDEAQERAAARMSEEGLELTAEQVAELSPLVGIGAVKYADLMQNRNTDYQFDWDKMISFKGNAGPYLQYAHARIQAILRKGAIDIATLGSQLDLTRALTLTDDAEIALAKHLLRFADVVHQAAETTQPHLVCEHLYGLARTLSVFYEQCPVLKAEGESRRTRIALVWMTARQLRRGLGLLGIAAPSRM